MLRLVQIGRYLGTYEFIRLRLRDQSVPAVEIIAGEDVFLDERPDWVDREALSAWLAAHGLIEIRARRSRPRRRRHQALHWMSLAPQVATKSATSR